eukprot:TRINITY_DN95017_c0_g1_i1.p1 TRINITY_DN95017_c0_g1~~TRINITY_DN95017_c0_g1_i1.p1  ORF type:complete len:701 (+),score=144.02 TRINITY_DN95017_c0_g1_i1:152-2104(+)
MGTGGRATAQHGTVSSTIETWLEHGGRGIDTAWMYLDQVDVAHGVEASKLPRKELFITTKLLACAGEEVTRWFVEYDLQRLNTSYIDLLLLHYPIGFDCSDTWKKMEEYMSKGVVRAIGVSNFQRPQLEHLLRTAKVRPAVNQVQVNLWYHNAETIAFCQEQNITVMAYSPLGWTGTPNSINNTNKTLSNPLVLEVAAAHGISPAQVALRWVLQQRFPLVVETHSLSHMLDDMDIFNIELSEAEMTRLANVQSSKLERRKSGGSELIAVLGQSGGDVQSCSEVEAYTKNLLKDGLLPSSIPSFMRSAIADAAWWSSKKRCMEEYEAVPNEDCNTRLRDVSVLQTQSTAARAREITGRQIQAFSGWKFAYGKGVKNGTTVFDALAKMQAMGVTQAFVFDQDFLAYDDDWIGLTYRQIRQYLSEHLSWNVSFVGFNGFTEQPGFLDLLVRKLKKQVQQSYPEVPAQDICIVLPSQGVPQSAEKSPGSGVPRIRKLFDKLQGALPEYNMTLVFTNHGGGPVAWSAPDDRQKVPEMARSYACQHVLATPILQWPQSDYTVYVFQGNGTQDEPGYAKTFAASGKTYRHAPAWDLRLQGWQGRPPAPGAVPAAALDSDLPDFIAKSIKDVLSGKTDGYDLTRIGPADATHPETIVA